MTENHRCLVAGLARLYQRPQRQWRAAATRVVALVNVEVHRKAVGCGEAEELLKVRQGVAVTEVATVGAQHDVGAPPDGLRDLELCRRGVGPQRQEEVGHPLQRHPARPALAQGVEGRPDRLALPGPIVLAAVEVRPDDAHAMHVSRPERKVHAPLDVLTAPGPVAGLAGKRVVDAARGVWAARACVRLHQVRVRLAEAGPDHLPRKVQAHQADCLRAGGRQGAARRGQASDPGALQQQVGQHVALVVRGRQPLCGVLAQDGG
mmetsp:Transcript_54297/g.154664  ORF Transcript_54297/g.154664 Transcript_54297/m.154664 type:complete len:263 (+) Transcript_54297:445-1233(+)